MEACMQPTVSTLMTNSLLHCPGVHSVSDGNSAFFQYQLTSLKRLCVVFLAPIYTMHIEIAIAQPLSAQAVNMERSLRYSHIWKLVALIILYVTSII